MQKTGEYNSNSAFVCGGYTGYVGNNSKCYAGAVRPVSAFKK